VLWGTQEFPDTSFAEHFSVPDEKAKLVAKFADGTTAGYEHGYGKGSAILLGTFVGQSNEAKPVAMHPLGGILATWAAGLTEPALKAPTLVELRGMDGERAFVFFFNHLGKGGGSGVHGGTGAVGRESAGNRDWRYAKSGGKKVCSEDRSPGAGG
jgi:hypothetical protein